MLPPTWSPTSEIEGVNIVVVDKSSTIKRNHSTARYDKKSNREPSKKAQNCLSYEYDHIKILELTYEGDSLDFILLDSTKISLVPRLLGWLGRVIRLNSAMAYALVAGDATEVAYRASGGKQKLVVDSGASCST